MFSAKNEQVQTTAKKVTKIILRITATRHAHLQTITKQNLQIVKKDPAKTVGGVAFTRLDIICDTQSDGQQTDGGTV